MRARAAVARADHDALALEVAQGRDRQVAAREHPDRLVEQPPDRAQLGVFRVPALLLLGGQASLQAADQVALDEAAVIPELSSVSAAGSGDPRAASASSPSVIDAWCADLDLDAVLAQARPDSWLASSAYCGVAGRDDDLAVPGRAAASCATTDERAHAQPGSKHRHRARPGDIRIHALPVCPCRCAVPAPAPDILENRCNAATP